MTDAPIIRILTYLADTHRVNEKAEVSGVELRHELQLGGDHVRECVAELARQDLVEWDPHLSNIWLRITDGGLKAAGR